MDLRITSTGRVFYQVDSTLAAILIEALPSVFEKHNPRPQPKPEELVPMWGVALDDSSYYHVTFKLLNQVQRFFGPPSQLVGYFAKTSAVVPDRIAQEYRQLWKPRDNEHPAVAEAYWAEYCEIHGIKE